METFDRSAREQRRRYALVVLLLLLLGALRTLRVAGPPPYPLDASYYFHLARNVEEGKGLVTNVGLYRQGIKELPRKAHIYPLWPLTLGYSGRIMELIRAANVLPSFFYLLDLVLLYVLANAIGRSLFGQSRVFGIMDLGHVCILLFGTNYVFYFATTYPYTEGLAFCCAFLSLLAVDRISNSTKKAAWGGVTGMLVALAYLTRSQMILLAIGIGVTLLVAARGSREYLKALLAYCLAAVAIVTPWYVFLSSFQPMRALIPFVQYRETPEVEAFTAFVRVSSFWEYVVDRAGGLLAAFNPFNRYSYHSSFGEVVWIVLAAAVLALWRWSRTPRLDVRIEPPRVLGVATLVSGLIFFATLFTFHAKYFFEWLFGWRHGLAFIFLIVVAVGYIAAHARPMVRYAMLVVLGISVANGTAAVMRESRMERVAPVTAAERELVRWLDAQEKPPTLLTSAAQRLSALSHANFQWTRCDTPHDVTQSMLAHLAIDYVAVYEHERECEFAAELFDTLQVARVFGADRERIYLLAGDLRGRPTTMSPNAF